MVKIPAPTWVQFRNFDSKFVISWNWLLPKRWLFGNKVAANFSSNHSNHSNHPNPITYLVWTESTIPITGIQKVEEPRIRRYMYIEKSCVGFEPNKSKSECFEWTQHGQRDNIFLWLILLSFYGGLFQILWALINWYPLFLVCQNIDPSIPALLWLLPNGEHYENLHKVLVSYLFLGFLTIRKTVFEKTHMERRSHISHWASMLEWCFWVSSDIAPLQGVIFAD